MREPLVDIDVEIVHQTDKAVLVHTGDEEDAVWVPKSQCEISDTRRSSIKRLTLSERLAIDKGLV